MKTKNKLLLVDGENLLHRSYHKFLNLKSKEGIPTGAIFGFMRSLNSMIFRFKPNHVMVTFDNGRSKYRLDVLPEYKGQRGGRLDMDYESLQKQKRAIMKILSCIKVPYIFDKPFKNNYEGDDYLALMEQIYKGKVIIVSSDKDFNQRISDRVKQYNPSKELLLNVHNCKEQMGYTPEECVDYLTLVGDTSDGIPGYPGIGEKKARIFLDEWKSIVRYLSQGGSKFPGIDNQELNKVYSKNQMLIDLGRFLRKYPLTYDDVPIKYPKKDIAYKRLNKYIEKYSLTSFKSDEFINEFKGLEIWNIKE